MVAERGRGRGLGACRLSRERGCPASGNSGQIVEPDGGVLTFPFALRDRGLRGMEHFTLDILAPHLRAFDPTWTVGMAFSLCPLEFSSSEDCR